ncbi:MAG: isoleucine--tRNA ligase [Clostridia bacterium]|nr:isoleucine--tRNA ligase [Clostridia bacterium]
MDYGKTLNLPQTEFSMRANLPQKEPQILEKWEENKIYDELMKRNEGKPSYVLHDGPPYANGNIHLGHTMNKILKDIIVRYKNMSGYKASYIPGWDTHGLPIEKQAIKKLGINPAQAGIVKFRETCREFALKYVDTQRDQFKRLGVIGDWENPYITLDNNYVAKQIEMFGQMAEKGLIYKGLKPVYWCSDCETALAEAEIEYQDDETATIYVKFPVNDGKGMFDGVAEKVFFVIWTTTTWTLPANLAICLNADFEYSLVKVGDEAYIFASELVDTVCADAGIENYEVIRTYKGSDLEYITCRHPFLDRDSLVIVGDHVTLEAGSGCVHTAPGHGMEDYIVCQKYPEIGNVVPVDAKGYLTEDAGKFAGLFYEESNKAILEDLKETGHLLSMKVITHSYPHCWRCKKPIIYRATEQWFASVDSIKEAALEAIKGVEWIPSWGELRISNMVGDRSDWCISRQRVWGVPIPIFYCKDCGKELINKDTIKLVADLFREKGPDSWFAMDANEILGGAFKCECGCGEFTKETDIMDVWFDSGSSHGAVIEERGYGDVADLYLEGNDQYRGWFQSSLLTSIATKGKAPYKSVLTHGMVIDEERRKMSKSLGNGIDPHEVIKANGADILRMWIASSDYKSDVKISKDILAQLAEGYRKIRNTARYMIGNLSDFNPDADTVAYENMQELDKWALMKLNALVKKVEDAYNAFDFHVVYHALHAFCVVDMSNFYLDVIKDRLYTEKADGVARRSAQTAMYTILNALVRMMSPIIAFSSEEMWKFMPHGKDDNTVSVLFNDMPKAIPVYDNEALENKYADLIAARADVQKALEEARGAKVIGHSLGADVTIYAEGNKYNFLKENEDMLKTLFIVSGAKVEEGSVDGAFEGEFGIKVKVAAAAGEKCERCWMFSETVGSDANHPTLCSRCAAAVPEGAGE